MKEVEAEIQEEGNNIPERDKKISNPQQILVTKWRIGIMDSDPAFFC